MTAGTILHASKLPHHRLVLGRLPDGESHSNGISALQLETARYRLLPQRLAARPQGAPAWSTPSATRCRASTQPSIPDQRRSSHHGGQGRSHDGKMLIVGAIELGDLEAACGWPKSPPTEPPTSDTSSKPPPIPTPSRKPTAGPATLRSPPIATMSMSSGRPPLTSSCRGSTKSSPTSKDGRRRLPRAASQASAGLSR